MTTAKIIIALSICIDLILIIAYIELHAVMAWYKKQFNSQPRAFRYVEKNSWQRRLVNLLLLRSPVAIKQPFKLIGTTENNFLETKNGSHRCQPSAVKASDRKNKKRRY